MTAEDLADRLPSDVKMLLLANPGQPVETCFDVQGLRFLAECCRSADAVFAVDEAYYGFGAPTALGLIDGFDNLVVLRTFSKAFGAAGIRVGFSVAGPRLTGALNAVRQSGEVSSLSMAVATVLIQQSDFVADSTAKIVRARDWLRARVSQDLGLNVWGRWANHVLIEFPSAETCGRVNALLAARGVLVKAGFQAPIDRHMLVTCGPMQLMTVFYSELKDAISCV
jgi:histidinol-phosphate/aromatic aminotransferase/cobyric acid decarboxylase-like protein